MKGNKKRDEGVEKDQAGLGFNPICTLNLSLLTSSLPALSASRARRMESTKVTRKCFVISIDGDVE